MASDDSSGANNAATSERPWEKLYSEKAKAFDADNLEYTLLAELPRATAAKFGNRMALTTVLPNGASATIDYNEVERASSALAAYLREVCGLAAGDVVAVQSPNCADYAIAVFGALKAGCIATNVNPLYTEPEMEFQLTDSGAKALIVIDLFGDKVDKVLARTSVRHVVRMSLLDYFPGLKKAVLGFVLKRIKKMIPHMSTPSTAFADAVAQGQAKIDGGTDIAAYQDGVTTEDTAIYQYTGGTTGRAKGAELSHRNVLTNAFQMTAADGPSIYDPNVQGHVLVVLPLYHIFAFTVCVMNCMMNGGHAVLIPNPRPLTNVKPAFDKFAISVIPGVNTLFAGLLHQQWFNRDATKSLRYCVAGGTALHEAVALAWQEATGVEICQGYGLTESSCAISVNPVGKVKLNHIGIPLPGIDVRIVDEDGNEVATGEPGELTAKGANIMKGYLNRAEETAATIKDGWLHTGDVAVIDEDGYLTIVDRMKDLILVSGFNVFPNELEDAISAMTQVTEVGVIGVPDERSGEVPKAFIVTNDPNLTAEEVIEHCKTRLTGYKLPRHIQFIDEVPKSPVGKILRTELRKLDHLGEGVTD
jgi:long-chain acyl-CoA synthetase